MGSTGFYTEYNYKSSLIVVYSTQTVRLYAVHVLAGDQQHTCTDK